MVYSKSDREKIKAKKEFSQFKKDVQRSVRGDSQLYCVLNEEKCLYVVKKQKAKKLLKIQSEINLQSKAYDNGLSLKIIDSFVEKLDVYIVMESHQNEKIVGTLEDYIIGKAITMKEKQIKIFLNKMFKKVILLYRNLHSIGIVYNKTKFNNIIVTQHESSKIGTTDLELYILDELFSLDNIAKTKTENESTLSFENQLNNVKLNFIDFGDSYKATITEGEDKEGVREIREQFEEIVKKIKEEIINKNVSLYQAAMDRHKEFKLYEGMRNEDEEIHEMMRNEDEEIHDENRECIGCLEDQANQQAHYRTYSNPYGCIITDQDY